MREHGKNLPGTTLRSPGLLRNVDAIVAQCCVQDTLYLDGVYSPQHGMHPGIVPPLAALPMHTNFLTKAVILNQ